MKLGGSSYGRWKCHTLLIMVAMIQCYRPWRFCNLTGTFAIGSRNLNPTSTRLLLQFWTSPVPPRSSPLLACRAPHSSPPTQPFLSYHHHFSLIGGKPDQNEAIHFHCHLWCPLEPFGSFKDHFPQRSFALLFGLPFRGLTRIP